MRHNWVGAAVGRAAEKTQYASIESWIKSCSERFGEQKVGGKIEARAITSGLSLSQSVILELILLLYPTVSCNYEHTITG